MDKLTFFRVVIVIFIVFVLFMFLSPEFDAWVQNSFGASSNAGRFLRDTHYEVPLKSRHPDKTVKEYYKTVSKEKLNHMIQTREKFNDQMHLGSPMTDGFHSDLPEDAKWVNGRVVRSKEIQNEAEELGRIGEERRKAMREAQQRMAEDGAKK